MTDEGMFTPPPKIASFSDLGTILADNSEGREIDIYTDDTTEDDVNPLERSLIKSILGRSDRSLNGYEIVGESPFKSTEKKGVSFNIAPGSADSSVADIDKSRDELYTKLDKTEMKLKQAEIDLSAEKTTRKKKERNLIKLAKELNKRASEQESREAEISKLKQEVATYEAKLSATRKELDERISAHEEKGKTINIELDDAQKKLRESAAAHDTKIAELTKIQTLEMDNLRSVIKYSQQDNETLKLKFTQLEKDTMENSATADKVSQQQRDELYSAQNKYREAVAAQDIRYEMQTHGHTEQTEELRRQILAANLEADKLRAQLASLQMMDATPEEAAKIVERTLRSSLAQPPIEEKVKSTGHTHTFLKYVGFGAVLFLTICYQLQLLSMNAVCSPVIPGTRLGTDMTQIAPWWAPTGSKSKAFELACQSSLQTSLNWHAGRLTISDKDGKILLDRKAPSAVVYGNIINFVDKRGKIETLKTPWSS